MNAERSTDRPHAERRDEQDAAERRDEQPGKVAREILLGEKGVVYSAGGKQVVWAFAALTLPLAAPSRIRDVIMGAESVGTELKAVRHRVYTIDSAEPPARE